MLEGAQGLSADTSPLGDHLGAEIPPQACQADVLAERFEATLDAG